MILPVWLYHKDSPERKVLIYALLDDASDSTFIKCETMRDLGLKGPEIKLNLYTMLGKEEICVEKICGLVVQRVDKRVEIELPKLYSDQVFLSEGTKSLPRKLQMNGRTLRRLQRSCTLIKVV